MNKAKDILAKGFALIAASHPAAAALINPRIDAITALLVRYIEEIERFNPAYGLVKARDPAELAVKHILDSAAPLGHIACLLNGRSRIADAGSGAGLPGIPLAVCLPQAEITLIERMGRRAGFLRNTLAVLGLCNTAVEEGETEKAGPGRFDVVAFRAFRPVDKALLKSLFRLLAPGGCLAAYKGRKDRTEAEMAAAGLAAPDSSGKNAGTWEEIPLEVPFLDEERRLAVIRPGVGDRGRPETCQVLE